MEFFDYEIKLESKDEVIELLHAGDSHIGSLNFARKEFNLFCNEASKNKRSFIIFMGDIFDSILPTDRRHNVRDVEPEFLSLSDAKDYFREKIIPFDERIIGMHQGNHERTFEQRTGICPLRELCKEIEVYKEYKVKYLYMVAITTIKLTYKGKTLNTYDLFSTHGSGGGYYLGGKVNKLQRYSNDFEADAYYSGHVHEGFSGGKPKIEKKGMHPFAKQRYYAFTLSFLKSYVEGVSGYEETKNYSPLVIGYLKTKIDRFKIHKPEEIIM